MSNGWTPSTEIFHESSFEEKGYKSVSESSIVVVVFVSGIIIIVILGGESDELKIDRHHLDLNEWTSRGARIGGHDGQMVY